ncbi:glutaredoxin-3-like [Lytechinus pictus]|uniref:glutaredoxin-3-like n=1 Tax=Lytechinus pictus TaxID=7653 RepID=UPI0030B9B119
MAELISIKSVEDFGKEVEQTVSGLLVVHFRAQWAPQCQQMNEVMLELAKEHPQVRFSTVEAEELPEISKEYSIAAVPTFILIKGKKEVDRLDGANVPKLTKMVQHHADPNASPVMLPTSSQPPQEDLNTKLKRLINAAPCVAFVKGSQQEPKCGFSRTLMGLLDERKIDYSTFDILGDDEVRQGLKKYSDWPTFPQVYVNGELIGGLDIIKELDASGELDQTLPKKTNLEDRLKGLINRSPVILFMKGHPGEPRCGFSRTITAILKDTGIKYDTFDILQDQEVRQGLKTFSNWPTFPQLYVNGELIGGLDIVKELQESGELVNILQG